MNSSVLGNEKGVVLVIALIMLMVLTVIGLASVNTSIFEAKLSGNERTREAAFYAASGGAEIGISRLPETAAYSGKIGSDENYRSGTLTASSAEPSKSLGLMFRPGFDTSWQFKRFQVNATGESSGSRAEIEVQVLLGPHAGGTSYNN